MNWWEQKRRNLNRHLLSILVISLLGVIILGRMFGGGLWLYFLLPEVLIYILVVNLCYLIYWLLFEKILKITVASREKYWKLYLYTIEAVTIFLVIYEVLWSYRRWL